MKLLKFFAVIFTVLFPLILFPQEYHPFPETNAFWTVEEYSQVYYKWDVYIYTIKGDSLINGKQYKKIWQLNDIPDSHDTLWCLHSFMRQDKIQKKVWFIRHYMNETTEKLGYDFDVQIGDTVILPAFDYFGDSVFVLIDPGDSSLLHNGEKRRNYFYACCSNNNSFYAIEGVGTQRTPFPNLLWYDPFHQSMVYCHKVNDVYIYGLSPEPDECDFPTKVNIISAQKEIEIRPNPCDANIRILFQKHTNSIVNIEIINSFGEIMLQKAIGIQEKEININTSHFPQGLYIIKSTTKSGRIFYNKIIVNH